MREPNSRIRSMALALLLVCAGALSYEPHPFGCGSPGEASLIPRVATKAAAAPAPSSTFAVEDGPELSPESTDPGHGDLSSTAPHRSVVALRPRTRVAPPSASGTALLGQPFPPANAPPHV